MPSISSDSLWPVTVKHVAPGGAKKAEEEHVGAELVEVEVEVEETGVELVLVNRETSVLLDTVVEAELVTDVEGTVGVTTTYTAALR